MLEQRSPQPRRQPANSSNTSPRIIRKKAPVIKQRRKSNSKLLVGAAIFISAISGAFLAASFPNKPFEQQQLSPPEAAVFNQNSFAISTLLIPSLTRPVNILVLGMSVLPPDVNTGSETRNLGYLPQVHSVDGLSDTMLLVRFNPETKKLTLLSIPRDTRVFIENHGIQKINAANKIGGLALAATEVSELLKGVQIDRYARINVLAVGKLVDALGGLTINVPKDLKYTDESQHLYINLKKGEQHLNGDKVMQFLRFRHDANGDIGRVERQQTVIHALIKQALNPLRLAALPHALSAMKSDIDTNMSVEELSGLALFAAQIDRSNVKGLVLPGAPNGNGRRSISYWLPNRRQISEMVEQYFN